MDKEENYSRLRTIHPLFVRQRFSGKWKFRKYIMETYKNIKEGTPDVHQNQQKKPTNHAKKVNPVSGKTQTAKESSSRVGEIAEV